MSLIDTRGHLVTGIHEGVHVIGGHDSWAIYSTERDWPKARYRYALGRVWDTTRPMLPMCALNPSTATHEINDPTIRREIQFAKDHGYGGLLKVNAFAIRSTDPEGINAAWNEGLDPVGVHNDTIIARACGDDAEVAVAAWGKPKPGWTRVRDRLLYLKRFRAWSVLKLTDDDKWPRHALYLKKDCRIQPWPAGGVA